MINRVSIFILASLLMSYAISQPVDNLFPDGRTVYSSQAELADYRLALGPLQKNNNVWQAEREEKMSGLLHRRTIEVNDSYSRREVMNTISGFFSSRDGRLLYSCDGLDCGSSAAWANESFGIKQLYGLDRYQHYRVWELNGETGTDIAVVYAVQRGNKRIYVQIDTLEVTKGSEKSIVSSPEAILAELDTKKYFVFPGIRFTGSALTFEDDHVDSVAAALARNPRLTLYLVGHDYLDGSLEEQLARSKSYAGQLKERLEKMGVSAGRLHVQGVGSLAPRGKNLSARLELVVR